MAAIPLTARPRLSDPPSVPRSIVPLQRGAPAAAAWIPPATEQPPPRSATAADVRSSPDLAFRLEHPPAPCPGTNAERETAPSQSNVPRARKRSPPEDVESRLAARALRGVIGLNPRYSDCPIGARLAARWRPCGPHGEPRVGRRDSGARASAATWGQGSPTGTPGRGGCWPTPRATKPESVPGTTASRRLVATRCDPRTTAVASIGSRLHTHSAAADPSRTLSLLLAPPRSWRAGCRDGAGPEGVRGGALSCDRGGRHRLRIDGLRRAAGRLGAPAARPGRLVHRWAAFNQVPPNFSPAQAAVRRTLVRPRHREVEAVDCAGGDGHENANPQLKVLVYHNGAFAQKNEGTKYPAAWYARDANGNKVVQTVFGNYLMDVSHPEWVAEVVRQCRAAKASTGADGCYTDMLMTAPLFENYASGGKPINPATGRHGPSRFPGRRRGDRRRRPQRCARALRGEWRGPGKAVVRRRRSSKTLTDHVDAAHSEIWLRDRTCRPASGRQRPTGSSTWTWSSTPKPRGGS